MLDQKKSKEKKNKLSRGIELGLSDQKSGMVTPRQQNLIWFWPKTFESEHSQNLAQNENFPSVVSNRPECMATPLIMPIHTNFSMSKKKF